MNKKVPLWFVLLITWIFCLLTIMFGWAIIRIQSHGPVSKDKKLSSIIISIASFPSLIRESFGEAFQPNPLIQANHFPDIQGLKNEKNYVDSNFILLSVYDKKADQSVVRLLRLSDQKIIYQWKPNFDAIAQAGDAHDQFWKYTNKHHILISHPLLSPDGSIIFNSNKSPLIKIDKNSKTAWVLNGYYDHSLEYDADGNIWTQSTFKPSTFLPDFLYNYVDNTIVEISNEGKVIFNKSVAQILADNGYIGLLLGVGPYEEDLLHLNDIQPALTSSKYWKKGDLFLSLRHRSTVLLYRPSTNKILWLKTGPWLNQHDVDLIDSTKIGVFGNNVVRDDIYYPIVNGHNEQYIYDFKTNKITTPYSALLKKAKVSTISGGRSDILPNGDIFIEESEKNRLLRGNAKDIMWQYVYPIDEKNVSVISWARFISKEEIKKLTFLNK